MEHFKYLGCNGNTNGTIEEEINRRIAKYSQNVGAMYRLLKDRNVPHKAKLVIHKTILRPILLYGHESVVTTKRLDSRIQAADMSIRSEGGSNGERARGRGREGEGDRERGSEREVSAQLVTLAPMINCRCVFCAALCYSITCISHLLPPSPCAG